MLLALVFALAQAPAPTQPPAPAPTPAPVPEEPQQESAPEEAQQESGEVSMEQISAAMDQVSKRMAEVSGSLRAIGQTADGAAPGASALDPALTQSRQLLVDLETLLALIPEPPQAPPDSGGDAGNRPQFPTQGNQPAPDRPEDSEQPSDGDEDGDSQESPDGDAQSPPDSPEEMLLQMPREGEWGNLPPRLQRTLEAANANEVPLRYRRWLVEYHRRAGGN